MREKEPMKLNNYPRLGNNLPPEGAPLGTLGSPRNEQFSQKTAEVRNSCKTPAGRALFCREVFTSQTVLERIVFWLTDSLTMDCTGR